MARPRPGRKERKINRQHCGKSYYIPTYPHRYLMFIGSFTGLCGVWTVDGGPDGRVWAIDVAQQAVGLPLLDL